MLSDEVRKQVFEASWIEVLHQAADRGEIPFINPYGEESKFGIEIELEGSDFPNSPARGWNVHNEGSLRGESREYVTRGPASFGGVHRLMTDLRHSFKDSGADLKKTYRASTHIHYNVQNKTLDRILKSIIRFVCFEPLVVELCGAERNGNLFCLPTYDCGDTVLWLNDFISKSSGKSKSTVAYNHLRRGKYAALNTDPLTQFGTLECRVFPTTVDTRNIIKWCTWLDNILGVDKGSITEYVKSLAKDTDTEVLRIFEDVSDMPVHMKSLIGFGVEQAWPLAVIYERAIK